MKRLDFHNEVAKRYVCKCDGFEWLIIPIEVAKAIYDADLPIDVYRVYDDESEGLVDEYSDFSLYKHIEHGVDCGEEMLLKYVDIQIEKEKEFPVFITEIHNESYDDTDEYQSFQDVLDMFNTTYDVQCSTRKELDEFIEFYNEHISEDEISYTEFNDMQSYIAYCDEIGWKPC